MLVFVRAAVLISSDPLNGEHCHLNYVYFAVSTPSCPGLSITIKVQSRAVRPYLEGFGLLKVNTMDLNQHMSAFITTCDEMLLLQVLFYMHYGQRLTNI